MNPGRPCISVWVNRWCFCLVALFNRIRDLLQVLGTRVKLSVPKESNPWVLYLELRGELWASVET